MHYTREEWRRTGVYAIVNAETGWMYIGETYHSFGYRWSMHKSALNRHCHANRLLQQDWLKYGPDAFEFRILEVFPRGTLRHEPNERERVHMAAASAPLYNIARR